MFYGQEPIKQVFFWKIVISEVKCVYLRLCNID